MAWTEACKIEAVAQIDKRKDNLGGIQPAIKDLSKESGIPCGTLKRWYYPETDYKSTRNGTPLAAPNPKVKPTFTQAMQIAIFVISHLERIMADDPEREAALLKVQKWINQNLKERD